MALVLAKVFWGDFEEVIKHNRLKIRAETLSLSIYGCVFIIKQLSNHLSSQNKHFLLTASEVHLSSTELLLLNESQVQSQYKYRNSWMSFITKWINERMKSLLLNPSKLEPFLNYNASYPNYKCFFSVVMHTKNHTHTHPGEGLGWLKG